MEQGKKIKTTWTPEQAPGQGAGEAAREAGPRLTWLSMDSGATG